jgi:hypothetical protein
MNTSPDTSHLQKPARRSRIGAGKDLDRFFDLLEKHGLKYDIRWRWEGGSTGRRGANRDGVLLIYRGDERIFHAQYERSSIRWTHGDCTLERLHEGSNRHYAVLDAINAMQQL